MSSLLNITDNEKLTKELCYRTVQSLANIKFFEEKKLQNIENCNYEVEKIRQWTKIYNKVLPLNEQLDYWYNNLGNFEFLDNETLDKLRNIVEEIDYVEKTETPLTNGDRVLIEDCIKNAEKQLLDMGIYFYEKVFGEK